MVANDASITTNPNNTIDPALSKLYKIKYNYYSS